MFVHVLAYLWINLDQKQLQKYYSITNLSLLNCFYQQFSRVNDKKIFKSGAKVELSYDEKYLILDEFIQVQCFYGFKNQSEYHSFLTKKPEVLKRVQKQTSNENEKMQEAKLNVMILGIDTLSRLNFHRTMKKSKRTLDKLGGIEFYGYNKVGKL